MSEERHSKPVAQPLITDKLERARRESENGLRQIDFVLERVPPHQGVSRRATSVARRMSLSTLW